MSQQQLDTTCTQRRSIREALDLLAQWRREARLDRRDDRLLEEVALEAERQFADLGAANPNRGE